MEKLRTARGLQVAVLAVFVSLAWTTGDARACSSCGCTLSSDWLVQGYAVTPGFHLDLRYDHFDQDQLRRGTASVDRGRIALPSDQEIQQETINRNVTATFDYSPGGEWGVSVVVPAFDRAHTTIAPGDTEISSSHTRSLGDVRVVGRYQGFFPDHTVGVQVGLKVATGAFHETFVAGPQAGGALDRGLQPGTGTTDLLLGVFRYGDLGRRWNYFAHALLQQPLNSREDFRPGTGLNVNLGARYTGSRSFVPQVQLNLRTEGRESGANADRDNSGATRVYLGPGLTVKLGAGLAAYGFIQVPVYVRVNGLQLEPRYLASFGVHTAF